MGHAVNLLVKFVILTPQYIVISALLEHIQNKRMTISYGSINSESKIFLKDEHLTDL